MSFHRPSYIYEGESLPIYLPSHIYVFISVYVLAMDRRQFLFLLPVLFLSFYTSSLLFSCIRLLVGAVVVLTYFDFFLPAVSL